MRDNRHRGIVRAIYAFAIVAGIVLLAISILPYVPSNRWWVRMADFPRLQWLVLCVVLLTVVAATGRGRRLRWPMTAALGLAATAHAITLAPFLPTASSTTKACPAANRVSVMVANVLMTSERSEDLFASIERLEPDLVLALETNKYWARELARLRNRYPYMKEQLGDDYYGLQLYSRLPLVDARIVHPGGAKTPAILAGVRLRDGDAVRFVGLHPRPPHPGQDSTARDAQLYAAALAIAGSAEATIVAGDFNATPWETTVARVRRIAGLIDPRRGYGYVATWDTKNPVLRWPLDHVLHTTGFTTLRIERGAEFGSDHFPFFVALCRTAGEGQVPEQARTGDLDAARAAIVAVKE